MKNIFAVILLLTFASTHAALIDHGTFFTDTDSGLDWLNLTPTFDRSYNDVSSKLGAGQEFDGWHYASGSEFEQLLLNGGVVPDSALPFPDTGSCSVGVNFCGSSRFPDPSYSEDEIIAVSDLLGNLAPLNILIDLAVMQGLLSDVDTGNIDPTAHFVATILLTTAVGGGIDTFAFSQAPGDTDSITGSYLVRTSTVPVPAAVWLFGSALGLLGWARRKTT